MARILLIDDDQPIRDMLVKVLSHAGHEVIVASNGFDGVALFRQQNADLVVTDLVMPHGGLPTIRVLREEFPALPIIAISGSRTPLAMAGVLGATRTMTKPFKLDELVAAIAAALPPLPAKRA
ncbi:MAG: response regulator [Opitutaceae bacterium]